MANSGTVGSGSVTIQWADSENNSGSFTVSAADTDYEVSQGVTVRFSAGSLLQDDSFTIDAYHPVLQAAQDKGLAQNAQVVHEGFSDLITKVTSTAATFVYTYQAGKSRSMCRPMPPGRTDGRHQYGPNNPGVRRPSSTTAEHRHVYHLF